MGGGGMMAPVMSIASGLLIFVILIVFAPTIAGSVESAQPAMGSDSDWNKTNNPDLPSGVEVWTQNIQILGVVVLIIQGQSIYSRMYFPWVKSIAVAMYYLRRKFEVSTELTSRYFGAGIRHGLNAAGIAV